MGANKALSGLKLARRHLARLVVALKVVAQLLAFNDFAHASAFDGRDVNEHISVAVVRLDEAEALGGIKPFNCAGGHVEALSKRFNHRRDDTRRGAVSILKGEVRRGHARRVQ